MTCDIARVEGMALKDGRIRCTNSTMNRIRKVFRVRGKADSPPSSKNRGHLGTLRFATQQCHYQPDSKGVPAQAKKSALLPRSKNRGHLGTLRFTTQQCHYQPDSKGVPAQAKKSALLPHVPAPNVWFLRQRMSYGAIGAGSSAQPCFFTPLQVRKTGDI